ncbi:DUF1761 domain-containing protein [Leptospira terpstrae]|uniref:PF08570 family protein n=1 Tax=Leptospira terpstrae serovar Hualin str. LT 11-33 = ATCC 700639 TaxID=1257025 RepID=N1VT45_9LEPT|nr:DUF1761 domain-containing protein [Leptospira terpstrae]EMY60147.1 PF08570 family protein [Leptospira terpstrae serovar Hualin str. LT 11-33 = ATCC 700639]
MIIPFTELDWMSILGATIAYSAFSGIWHRQFAFGKKWEEAMGFKRPENWKETAIYYIVPSISCLITTIATASLIKIVSLSTLIDAFSFGINLAYSQFLIFH